jgi:salicylate hydroxylase
MKKKIGIVGGGVAGLILACFLKKNENYEFQIYEKDLFNVDSFNGVQLTPNSVQILNNLYFGQFPRENLCEIKKILFYDGLKNNLISNLNLQYLYKSGDSYITLNRNNLISFFIEKFDLSEKILRNKVSSINYDQNSIILDNKENVKFDYIFLCDGVFSKLHPNTEDSFIYSGYSAYRGAINQKKLENFDQINLLFSKKFHLVFYPTDKKGNLSFTLILNNQKLEDKINDSLLENLKKVFQDKIQYPFDQIFSAKEVTYWPIFTRGKIFYGLNNVFCLGDSAHGFLPTRAQGFSQAIEDAYVSYNLLIQNKLTNNNLESNRLKRIQNIIVNSNRNIFWFHIENPFLRIVRNILIKLICKFDLITYFFNRKIFNFKMKL